MMNSYFFYILLAIVYIAGYLTLDVLAKIHIKGFQGVGNQVTNEFFDNEFVSLFIVLWPVAMPLAIVAIVILSAGIFPFWILNKISDFLTRKFNAK